MHIVTHGNVSTILYTILLLTWTRTILTSLVEERVSNCISYHFEIWCRAFDHSAFALQCDVQKYLCYRMKRFTYYNLYCCIRIHPFLLITTIQSNNVCNCHFLKNSLEVEFIFHFNLIQIFSISLKLFTL